MWLFRVRTLLIFCSIGLAAGVGWLVVHDRGEEQAAAQKTMPSPALSMESTATNPLVDDTQLPPVIYMRGVLQSPDGQRSALLEVANSQGQWFRRGDTVSPGYIVTAIDKAQVTIRDDQHNAYYEYSLNSGVDSENSQDQAGVTTEKEPASENRNAMNYSDPLLQGSTQALDENGDSEQGGPTANY